MKTNLSPKLRLIITAAIIILVAVLSLAANVRVVLGQDGITASATFAGKTAVSYTDIETVQLIDNLNPGSREMGLGLPWLLGGSFKNSEYGSYKLYSYNNCKLNIAVTYSGGVLVFNRKTEEATTALYYEILKMIGE
ncbi:MAG: hypothetical protein GX942_00405 [Papillibacter sp.]|jgi:hypothetical protein|nr:hypothetical protein [Papillibacter sp.]